MTPQVEWPWPTQKRIAVCFTVCLEGWSDGKAPGISPMGNPLPAGVLDTMAISWAAYGAKRGIYRLLDAMQRYNVKGNFLVNAVVAERSPEAVKAIAQAGHALVAHSYAMDVVAALLSEEEERKDIARSTALLEAASGQRPTGWICPRGTPSARTPRLLVEAGYQWVADAFDDDLPYILPVGDGKLVVIPTSTDVNDMPSMKYGNAPKMMLESFIEMLEIANAKKDSPTLIDVTVHAHIFGRLRGSHYFEKVVEKAANSGDVWIGTRPQIAQHVLKTYGDGSRGQGR
jgi:hypothetical protein